MRTNIILAVPTSGKTTLLEKSSSLKSYDKVKIVDFDDIVAKVKTNLGVSGWEIISKMYDPFIDSKSLNTKWNYPESITREALTYYYAVSLELEMNVELAVSNGFSDYILLCYHPAQVFLAKNVFMIVDKSKYSDCDYVVNAYLNRSFSFTDMYTELTNIRSFYFSGGYIKYLTLDGIRYGMLHEYITCVIDNLKELIRITNDHNFAWSLMEGRFSLSRFANSLVQAIISELSHIISIINLSTLSMSASDQCIYHKQIGTFVQNKEALIRMFTVFRFITYDVNLLIFDLDDIQSYPIRWNTRQNDDNAKKNRDFTESELLDGYKRLIIGYHKYFQNHYNAHHIKLDSDMFISELLPTSTSLLEMLDYNKSVYETYLKTYRSNWDQDGSEE